jgi:tetratricopeptide (TPR) repeat protein
MNDMQMLDSFIQNDDFPWLCAYLRKIDGPMGIWIFSLQKKKNPLSFTFYHTASHIYQMYGKYHLAIRLYKIALSYDEDNSQICTMLGTVYKKLQDFENALLYYQKAVKWDPENYIKYLHIAFLYAHLADKRNAQIYLKKSIKLWGNTMRKTFYSQCEIASVWGKELLEMYMKIPKHQPKYEIYFYILWCILIIFL